METESLLTGSVNGAPGDYGSRSGPDNERAPSSRRMSYSVARESCSVERDTDDEDLYVQQAIVFIEDAIQYRSINHRVDASSLRLYRWYYSRICQWGLGLTITVVLLLAFVERPSSLSVSSDPRHSSMPWEPPCGFTESIEIVCLMIFCLDLAVKSYLIGWDEFRKSKWLIGYTVVISVSIIDWVLSVSMVCDEKLRVRRLLRPFFLLQNSSLMKKTLKCIKRTLPEIASVILLLALHLCLFTMIGMLLFAKTEDPKKNGEWRLHFRNLTTSLTSLLVLLTTANNPDVMIPAYSLNRGYAIFFVAFSVIGTYCLMNLLTAIIYNQFRGYLLMSVQTSIIRRRLGIRAAFQVLSCQGAQRATEERVRVDAVLEVMSRVQMKSYYRAAITTEAQRFADLGFMDREQFRKIFEELDKDRIKEHPPLPQYNSLILQRLQTILVLNSEKSTAERDNYILEIINLCFILFYLFEMCVKIFAFGWRGYLSYRNNIFDGFLTILLLALQITIYATYRLPYSHWDPSSHGVMSLWEMVRLVNMLIVFRFLRIIPDIKLMALVASTLLDLVKNLRAFAGILVVVYYVFAVFGIWLFEGAIKPPPEISVLSNTSMENITSNLTMECGTYEQLQYWPNNFDDFAASIILLYDVMIVNNWQAFMDAYSRYTTEWAKIYFVCWWLTSSVMWVNLFVALILENFIYRWDRSHSCSVTDVERIRYETSVQLMFKEQIQEPTEEELLCQLHQHPHLHLH
ncbi:two pore calcium channel protein 2 isoform X2 [Seriola dumerili]|uniref:two pore calcium channel protein 2 isoform X2 n=1 Tax=Seriola dumerili TaxID=41447 RepID=UPI000BBE300B|nr:two pore calcium channel protein 2 isoform X2 [Seriola dumerili]